MRISDWSSDVCSSDLLGAMTGEDALSWRGYLAALARRRRDFMAFGATASDHGHPTAFTANLPPAEAEVLFARVASGRAAPADAELFRGQMLTEMARMSLEDGDRKSTRLNSSH